jgi:hypothetical protein
VPDCLAHEPWLAPGPRACVKTVGVKLIPRLSSSVLPPSSDSFSLPAALTFDPSALH